MGIFEIPDWETLRIAGIGRTRTGKTTLFASNAVAPIYAIDSDKGFVRARRAMNNKFPELNGKVYSPSQQGCLIPLHIHQEAERNVFQHGIKTIVIDSVSKIYEFNTRPAVMAGRLSSADRVKYGFSKNKASNLQNKADAIQTISYIAAYGTHIFYVWHEKETVDMENIKNGKMEKIMKETMSVEERKRLMTSVDIVLYFSFSKGKYAVTVGDETRGYADKPNTGFTIYDRPGNYWRNSLARIYGLIYTTFSGQDEAINWGLQTLGKEDPVELGAFYEEIRGRANPEKPGDMWVAWMLAIEEKHNGAEKRAQEDKDKKPVIIEGEKIIKEPEQEQIKEPVLVSVDPTGDMQEQKPDPGGADIPSSVYEPQKQKVDLGHASLDNKGNPLTYGEGDFVREEHIADYKIYQNQFGYDPDTESVLLRAKDAMGDDWED